MMLRCALSATALLATLISTAEAQPAPTRSPVARADAHGTIGWENLNKSGLGLYDDWANNVLFGGATFGWYWTDNVKTEIEGGISSEAKWRGYATTQIDGRQMTLISEYHFQTRNASIAQQYQFFRNAWFHPFVAAGVDFAWDTTARRDDEIRLYETGSTQPRISRPEIRYPTRTDFAVRPFTSVGFKTYLSQRAFFRSDLKLAFDSGGVNQALVRCGFGVDF